MDGGVRRSLLALFVFASLGTGTELLLLEHTEETAQWAPLALIGSALAVLAWHSAAASRASVRVFQAVMVMFALSGGVGTVLHYRANAEFEREMHPDATAGELFRGAMMGATPALAPGTMVLLGTIGLLFAYRHPAARRPDATGLPSREES